MCLDAVWCVNTIVGLCKVPLVAFEVLSPANLPAVDGFLFFHLDAGELDYDLVKVSGGSPMEAPSACQRRLR